MSNTNNLPLIIAERALILNDKNQLLLVTHQNENFWYTPGGRRNNNESLIQCAQREVYEELGLKVDLEKLVYVDEFIGDHRSEPKHYIAFYFFGRTDEELIKDWRDSGGDAEIVGEFLSKEQIEQLNELYPTFLKDRFWKDLENNFQNHNPYTSSI